MKKDCTTCRHNPKNPDSCPPLQCGDCSGDPPNNWAPDDGSKFDIYVVDTHCETTFENQVKELVDSGYHIKAMNCGFVNSEEYDFCKSYQAILTRGENS